MRSEPPIDTTDTEAGARSTALSLVNHFRRSAFHNDDGSFLSPRAGAFEAIRSRWPGLWPIHSTSSATDARWPSQAIERARRYRCDLWRIAVFHLPTRLRWVRRTRWIWRAPIPGLQVPVLARIAWRALPRVATQYATPGLIVETFGECVGVRQARRRRQRDRPGHARDGDACCHPPWGRACWRPPRAVVAFSCNRGSTHAAHAACCAGWSKTSDIRTEAVPIESPRV